MKAIVFDFDGTLTEKKGNLWKKIWQTVGYDVGPDSYFIKLYKKYMSGSITHNECSELTLKALQEKDFTKQKLDEITDNMTLIDGAEELIKNLNAQGLEIHIVSGNIVSVIEKILGENKKFVSAISANEILFDENGKISKIVCTKYDCEGKATYIKELCQRKGYNPSDVLFVGNGMNDEWVYTSGARTLCVNPDDAKSENAKIWNKVIHTDNLMDLEKEI